MKEHQFSTEYKTKMKVDLFIPCFIDQLYPRVGFAVIRILERLGIEVHYNTNQTCCGQPAFNSGYWDEARKVANKFLNDFRLDRPIICPSASCTGFVKNYYKDLFEDEGSIYGYEMTQKNLFELTDFLVNTLKVTDLGASFPAKATYHDSCSALREYGIFDEPRALLSKVKGLELIEMEENTTCCGFGGTFSIKNEPISTAMAEQKVEFAMATGAEYIISTDASCLLHQEAYIKKQNFAIKTIHIAEVLASR